MAKLSILPGHLPITIYVNNTKTVILNWPAGHLDGTGPWTATVTAEGNEDIDLPVAVVDDQMSITIPDVSTLLGAVAEWSLDEGTQSRLAGRFHVTNTAGPSVLEQTVVIQDQTVTVQAVVDGTEVAANLTTHEADEDTHGWTTSGTSIIWNGAILTDHDAQYFEPADMVGTAGFVSNAGTLNAPPLWQFDQATVERVKWLWTPGDAWQTYVVRLGWMNTAFASGNVTWRYYERRTRVASGNPEGNWTTNPTLVNTFTAAAPTLDGNRYDDLAVGVPVEPLTVVLSVLDRDTSVTPTLGADAGVYLATATRTT